MIITDVVSEKACLSENVLYFVQLPPPPLSSYALTRPCAPPPIIEVTSPPYQVCETGWGGFEILVEIHLRDPAVPPIRLTPHLKLYPEPGSSMATSLDRPVLSEVSDELVFNALPADPTLSAAILRGPVVEPPRYPYQEFFTTFSSEADLLAIAAARKWLVDRTEELEERLSKAKAASATLRNLHLAS